MSNGEGRSGPGALAGLRVIDFTRWLAGPIATSFLGDFGADVIKIERPGVGDDARHIDDLFGAANSSYFIGTNRSKKSVTIDLAHPRGLEVARRLISRSDVLIENFRVGVMVQLGLDYDTVRDWNRALIYCSISSYGQSGPYATKPGLDLIVQALGGVMGLTGEAGGAPTRVGSPIADYVGGYLALSAVLLALHERERSGEGQHVAVSLLDGQVSLLANYLPGFVITGQPSGPVGKGHPQLVPYQAFATADSAIVVACVNDRFWLKLCDALGRADLAANPDYARNVDRVRRRRELISILEPIFLARPTEEWLAVLEGADVPVARINRLSEIVCDEQVLHNEMIVELSHRVAGNVKVTGNPIKLERTPASPVRPAPILGEDTDSVLDEAGFSAREIADLRAAGAI